MQWPFSALWRQKFSEIDPEALQKLVRRVKKLSKQLDSHIADSKKDALDLGLLYDKAQGAVSRLNQRTLAANKKLEEGVDPPEEEIDEMQALRVKYGPISRRR